MSTVTGSFNASAILKKTQPKTLTLDAFIVGATLNAWRHHRGRQHRGQLDDSFITHDGDQLDPILADLLARAEALY